MRTLELLRCLSDKEVGKVDEQVKSQKRKSLQLLYGLLKKYRKRNGMPANEELYLEAFGKEYSTDKNYLIRHELRLLNEILYNYLIQDTFREHISRQKTSYHNWLGQTFLKRQLHNAFIADIDRFIEHGKDSNRPDDVARLVDMKSLWLTSFGEKTATAVQEQLELTDALLENHIRSLRYKVREIEARRAFLKEYLNMLSGTADKSPADRRTGTIQTIDLGKPDESDAAERALILKKHLYETSGLHRIEILVEIKTINDAQEFDDPQRTFENKIALINNIAVEYANLHDFAASEKYLREGIELCRTVNKPVLHWLVLNFIANQLIRQRYAEGIDFFTRHGEPVKQSADYFRICINHAYCHLFLKKTDSAIAALPPDTNLPDQQLLQTRMVYLISFMIRNELELALNECRNINRLIKANDGSHYENYDWLLGFYSKYLKALAETSVRGKPNFTKLMEELKASEKKLHELQFQEPALLWFVREINFNGAT